MQLKNCSLAIFAMLFLGAAAFLGGCAATGMDRSVKTVNSIDDVDNEIRKVVVQIDITDASLNSLIKAEQPDLKKSFSTYSDELATLDKMGKQVLKRIEEMRSQSKEYFAEWEKQGEAYTNPQIRALSEQRRYKLAEIYARVPAAGAGIKGTFIAYLTDLNEIRMYLSNDLTPAGVKAIAPVAGKTVQDVEDLKTSIQPVISALDEIKAELYGGGK